MEPPAPPPPPPVTENQTERPSAPTNLTRDLRRFNKSNLNSVGEVRGEKINMSKFSSYGIEDDEDKTEYYDTPEDLDMKVKKLSELLTNCKSCVTFTGAGISTSANLPDYRGPQGVWTMLADGKHATKSVTLYDACPTKSHMSLAKLVEKGYVKHIVSTNLDGLHLRSGVPVDKVSELHGNAFKLKCKSCETYWFCLPEMDHDDVYKKVSRGVCPDCGSRLFGTGVGFGCELPAEIYAQAKEIAMKQDLALVLGTSLRVAPSANLPEYSYKNKGHLVICNLQKTPYDKYAALVIRARLDVIMEKLMKLLSLDIPSPPTKIVI
eukprot:TRINITY_DN6922_c0_g1_i1.p1 TRINITY_DN6922_c0_g1~~TRINITY_DN6922_c0_g1_i1.p1  ORF type:complete len:322 (-),score=59.43 TRINITY_DN6922_c0_g1_i1:228-1193(-)